MTAVERVHGDEEKFEPLRKIKRTPNVFSRALPTKATRAVLSYANTYCAAFLFALELDLEMYGKLEDGAIDFDLFRLRRVS